MYSLTISGCVAAVLAASTLVSSAAIHDGLFPKRELTDAAPRIIGGRPSPSTSFQYIAYIEGRHPIEGGSSCTGSLIGPNVVLTAAHCIYASDTVKYTASQIQVGFTHTLPDPTVRFKGYSVAQIVPHPKFSMTTLKHDIALLILSSNVPETAAKTAKLFSGPSSAGASVTAAGFGLINPYSKTEVSDTLMEVDLKLGSASFCRTNFPGIDTNNVLCTDGAAGKDTCNGDSGGPLAIAMSDIPEGSALLGLTSFGPVNAKNPEGLCAQAGIPGYYTRISPYISWIAEAGKLSAESIAVGGAVTEPEVTTPKSSSKSSRTSSKTTTRTTPTDDKVEETPTEDDNGEQPTTSTTRTRSSLSPLFPPNAAPASLGSSGFALAMAVLGSVAAFVAA
ncbi:hypothetical protein GGF42_002436 [Coemansia sp. RSA 2424]|nr:hypothetical protein GGF42_002436 [Coemansia sp. RSA 2424]